MSANYNHEYHYFSKQHVGVNVSMIIGGGSMVATQGPWPPIVAMATQITSITLPKDLRSPCWLTYM